MIKSQSVLKFGKGDILITAGSYRKECKVFVGLNSLKKPMKVGTFWKDNKTSKLEDYEVLMTFDNVESLDSVIKALERVKDILIDKTEDGDE